MADAGHIEGVQENLFRHPKRLAWAMDAPKLDAIDRRILRALHRNARLTNAELAEQVGLSPSPCWTRARRLGAAGVIRGYVAILDQASLGLPDTVIIEVMMERHDEDSLARLEA